MEESNDLLSLIDKHKDQPGIDVYKLKPETVIEVVTQNSTYELKVSHTPGYVYAKGGKHIKIKTLVHFNGCTFGGSAIRSGWIGRGMHMEIMLSKKRMLTTTKVKAATIHGDGWKYELWEN